MDDKPWAEAFAAAQAEMPDIPKTCTATIPTKSGGYDYRYADLPSILSAVRPVLHKHGLSVAQEVAGEVGTVAVSTIIFHTSGFERRFGPLTLAVAGDARAAGSAITYARRYSLTAALGIAPDDDDDAAVASTPKPAAKPKPQPAAKPAEPETPPEEAPEITPEEITERLENKARLELLNRCDKDKEKATGYWPIVLKEAGVKQVRTKADRAKVIAKIQEMFPNNDERPF